MFTNQKIISLKDQKPKEMLLMGSGYILSKFQSSPLLYYQVKDTRMTLMESLFNFFVSRVVPLFVSRAIKHEADILYLYVLLYLYW